MARKFASRMRVCRPHPPKEVARALSVESVPISLIAQGIQSADLRVNVDLVDQTVAIAGLGMSRK